MLVDAAKQFGDVEIPVFCYEPKLGAARSAPAACAWSRSRASRSSRPAARRPCATAWSSTRTTERVQAAQSAVVEFLLVNHPLDCPVCDKGGECPLQDITYGWGPGKSRFDRAQAPLREAARALAADRDRPRALHPLLPLRALSARRSAEDDQLRAPSSAAPALFVGTFDGHPYVAPFTGNIIELCPVGALTIRAYRFRARPGTSSRPARSARRCPAPVQRQLHGPRRAREAGADPRQRRRSTTAGSATAAASPTRPLHVDERVTRRFVRKGEILARRAGTRRSPPPPRAQEGRRTAASALAGRETTSNEEAFLLAADHARHLGSNQ